MRVLICGDRDWTDHDAIEKVLRCLPSDAIVIHGAARGADRLAGSLWDARGGKVDPYPAKWKLYGKAAGPIRNRQMLVEGKPDMVIAFHNNIENSKGTKDMVERATKAGLPVKVIKEGQDVLPSIR